MLLTNFEHCRTEKLPRFENDTRFGQAAMLELLECMKFVGHQRVVTLLEEIREVAMLGVAILKDLSVYYL